jgi:membrane protein implicated in regulation of membrane protease activity
MLGIYLLAAILGGGLLVFSLLGGGEHDAGHGDASGLDAGHDFDHGGHDVGAGHDAGTGHEIQQGWAGELVLGLFRPRNLTFFLAGFGVTGTLVTLLTSRSTLGALIPSIGMGLAAMLATHATFLWLARSDSAVDAVSDSDLEGCVGRVVVPLSPGERGQIACRVGDHMTYVTATLAEGYTESLPPGREVVVLDVDRAVARVMPFTGNELPPAGE